jgi:hypothetical protein
MLDVYLGVVTIDGFWIGWLDLLRLYTQLITTSDNSATADLHTLQFTLGFSVFTSRILAMDFNILIMPVSL